MTPSTILLVSTERSLVDCVQRVVEAIDNCAFVSHREIPKQPSRNIALVIVHLPSNIEDSSIERFVRGQVGGGRGVPILLICDEYESSGVLKWLNIGVADCLARPLDLSRLSFLVDSLTIRVRSRHLDRSAPATTDWLEVDGQERFCCASNCMTQILQTSRSVAQRDTNVLLTGETGCGKTRMARLLHSLSRRNRDPFLAVNCGAIPETLLESELFGHAKGAFTGADVKRSGVFAQVGSGTILLDELDSLSAASQAKLLHVVEDRKFFAVGESVPRQFEGRMIFATNQPLEELVRAGEFRRDLYYRVKIMDLAIPPLRARRSEIRLLAEAHLESLARRYGEIPKHLSPSAVALLEAHEWPGNIRELHNVMERVSLFAAGTEILASDLPHEVRRAPATLAQLTCVEAAGEWTDLPETPTPHEADMPGLEPFEAKENLPLQESRKAAERQVVMATLRRNGNNRTRTAKDLGISRAALYKKLSSLALL